MEADFDYEEPAQFPLVSKTNEEDEMKVSEVGVTG